MAKKRKAIIPAIILLVGLIVIFIAYIKNHYRLLATPVSPLYYARIGRESMQSLFVFGDEDRSNWYFTLSEKRTKEAEILQIEGWNRLAKKQIKTAEKYYSQGNDYLSNLIDKVDVNYLIQKSDRIKDRLDLFNQTINK